MKLLASAFIFTKLSTKTLLLWRRRVSFEYQGLLQKTPASFFLSMFKLHCKRHYGKLSTYSWCTTWREHVTKTAPARRWHSVGGGGGAAAAAHSSSTVPSMRRQILLNARSNEVVYVVKTCLFKTTTTSSSLYQVLPVSTSTRVLVKVFWRVFEYKTTR